MGKFVILVGVIAIAILLWPFAIIWAINTLFPLLAIQYTFWTWLAVLIITGTFGSKVNYGNSK